MSKSVYKPKSISGFPEWTPEVRIVEQQWLDHIRRVFESYGFCSIETPSVEELGVLQAKGEVDKEIYVLERLHKEETDKEARLGLHFDLTVPLARYVAQNFNELVFPFKRYQMQRVWRGERPQAGRFREFTQCDIDVIGIDTLPIHFDAEMPAIMWEVLNGLPGMENETFFIRINNRKLLVGYLRAIGVNEENLLAAIMNSIDKREKVGEQGLFKLIDSAFHIHKPPEIESSETLYKKIEALIRIRYANSSQLEETLDKLEFKPNDLFEEGKKELISVLDTLDYIPKGNIFADLSIVRGLDYYTGTVYETLLQNDPGYGSICSGGRYDDLAGQYINKNLPGVGISIGFSRLFARLLEQGKLPVGPKSPAHVLMILPSEERRADASKAAQTLRKNGYNVELYHAAKKIPDQMKYASRKGIPFVWFPDEGGHTVKNMATGEQKPADPGTWEMEGRS